MGVKEKEKTKPLINRNLLSLKLVLFLFFGGLGCLYPFLPVHMLAIGLNRMEARIISIVAPLVSILGPLIFGPLADRLAGKGSISGKYLRIMAVFTILLGALFYGLLMAVPSVTRFEARRPLVSFACDQEGALIFQERCTEERTCFHWKREKMGSLILTNCSYTCQKPSQFESLYSPWTKGSPPPPAETSSEQDYAYDDGPNYDGASGERVRRNIPDNNNKIYVEPPHLCIKDEDKPVLCHVYTEDTKSLRVQATLHSAENQENETHSADWCRYPLDNFSCNIPEAQALWMANYMNSSKCKPMIECEVHEPYDTPGSVLADSQCIKIIGDVDVTFWSYLLLRCLADIFPTATITLLNTAIIIATRETSSGRGDVGRQLVWGAVGLAIFSSIVSLIEQPYDTLPFLIPIVVFMVLSVLASITLLFANNMPLSPPEWWWHTKSGMVAIPMSAIRKYGPEAGILTVITLLLGIFWNTIDTYQTWYILELSQSDIFSNYLLIGLTVTVGALLAIPILWNVEAIVDYCGHSNLLIVSFIMYIIRYTALAVLVDQWLILIVETLQIFTLTLTWIAIILYMRHIIPRRLTATGQALPVIAHFCLGKSIGAIIGLFINKYNAEESLRCIYRTMAIIATILAILYIILYYFVMIPRCTAKHQSPPSPNVLQGSNTNGGQQPQQQQQPNTNGNYTPLRVYHNGRGKKGHFRY